MSIYQEPVHRFRVMRQLNDPERNPDNAWNLIYSTPDLVDAENVAAQERFAWGYLEDKFKVIDSGVIIEYIIRRVHSLREN